MPLAQPAPSILEWMSPVISLVTVRWPVEPTCSQQASTIPRSVRRCPLERSSAFGMVGTRAPVRRSRCFARSESVESSPDSKRCGYEASICRDSHASTSRFRGWPRACEDRRRCADVCWPPTLCGSIGYWTRGELFALASGSPAKTMRSSSSCEASRVRSRSPPATEPCDTWVGPASGWMLHSLGRLSGSSDGGPWSTGGPIPGARPPCAYGCVTSASRSSHNRSCRMSAGSTGGSRPGYSSKSMARSTTNPGPDRNRAHSNATTSRIWGLHGSVRAASGSRTHCSNLIGRSAWRRCGRPSPRISGRALRENSGDLVPDPSLGRRRGTVPQRLLSFDGATRL